MVWLAELFFYQNDKMVVSLNFIADSPKHTVCICSGGGGGGSLAICKYPEAHRRRKACIYSLAKVE